MAIDLGGKEPATIELTFKNESTAVAVTCPRPLGGAVQAVGWLKVESAPRFNA